jgi:hypothetical protein
MKLPSFILHENLIHGSEAVILVFGQTGEHHTGMAKLTGIFLQPYVASVPNLAQYIHLSKGCSVQ